MGTQSKGWALFILAMSPRQKIKTMMNYTLLYKILLSETKLKFVLLKIQKIKFLFKKNPFSQSLEWNKNFKLNTQ